MKTAPHFGVIDIGNSGIKAALAETATQHLVGPVRSLHWSFPSDTSKLPPKEFLESGSTRSSIDDLDAIDWTAAHGAYGPAGDVPNLVRALASQDDFTVIWAPAAGSPLAWRAQHPIRRTASSRCAIRIRNATSKSRRC